MWNLNTVSVWPRSASLRVGWDSLPSWAAAEIVILATRMQRLSFYHPSHLACCGRCPMFISAVFHLIAIPGRPGLDGWGQSVVVDHWMFLGNKVIAYRAAHFLSRFRAHFRQPEGRNGKRLNAGKHGENKPWISMEWNSFVPGFDKFMQISHGSQTGVTCGELLS